MKQYIITEEQRAIFTALLENLTEKFGPGFDDAFTLLRSLPEAAPEPAPEAGQWQMVPVEPTIKMLLAAETFLHGTKWQYVDKGIWQAMLAAAPKS